MKVSVVKWVVDAHLLDGWIYNYAEEDFDTEADAMRFITSYGPYAGADRFHCRAVDRMDEVQS